MTVESKALVLRVPPYEVVQQNGLTIWKTKDDKTLNKIEIAV